ncbi:MAG: DUF2199 domain-containing protein [Proteobacteria bacterium]|nr:DUF2199 domain-containing protein [Pseudomonadota bacterium]
MASEDWITLRLEDDPRWRRLHNRPFVCRTCGATHEGFFDVFCVRPEQWTGGEEYSPNGSVLTSGHFLSEDFCILDGEHFFVRSVLLIPILGAPDESFGFGVWSTLSKKNFSIYVDAFESGECDGLGPWFGWFSNRLEGYPDTLNLKCQVHPRSGRMRPIIELEPIDHPLVDEQRHGVSFDRLLDIYAAHGHDLRAALVD